MDKRIKTLFWVVGLTLIALTGLWGIYFGKAEKEMIIPPVEKWQFIKQWEWKIGNGQDETFVIGINKLFKDFYRFFVLE